MEHASGGIMADIKHVPLWVWGVCVAGALVLVALHRRSAARAGNTAAAAYTTGTTAGAATSGNGNMYPGATTPDALPSQYNPAPAMAAAPASTQTGLTFKDWFNLGTGWQDPRNSGFNGNATDSLTGGRDWAETLAQFHSTNPAFTAWQTAWLGGAGATNPGDVNAGHDLYRQGMQFMTDPSLQGQVVAGQGQIAQYNQQYTAPAPSAGGGGYAMHPDASPTGSMSDMLSLVGPGAPSIHGTN